jgi:hypothetical protein
MGKRRPATRLSFDPAIHTRLLAVGAYELVTDAGGFQIQFDSVLKAAGLPDFEMWWFATGPGRVPPEPDDELFALWERYRAAHAGLCAEYRRRLFGLLSGSAEGQYTARQWRQLGRKPPTERDLRGAVSGARVELHQQQARGEPTRVYEVHAMFEVSWNEHGVDFLVEESDGWHVLGG